MVNHNPTDGLGVPVAITLTADIVGLLTKVGSSVALSPGNRIGGHQYALSLSVAGVPTVPLVYTSTTIHPLVVDASGLTYTFSVRADDTANGRVPTRLYNKCKARVYESPANGDNAAKEIVYLTTNNLGPATDNTFTLTALNPGQAIVEIYFPANDFVYATDQHLAVAGAAQTVNAPTSGVVADFIYSQIIVTVGA